MKTTNFLCYVLLTLMVSFCTSCSDDENSYDETLVIASEVITTNEGTAYWVKKTENKLGTNAYWHFKFQS